MKKFLQKQCGYEIVISNLNLNYLNIMNMKGNWKQVLRHI